MISLPLAPSWPVEALPTASASAVRTALVWVTALAMRGPSGHWSLVIGHWSFVDGWPMASTGARAKKGAVVTRSNGGARRRGRSAMLDSFIGVMIAALYR